MAHKCTYLRGGAPVTPEPFNEEGSEVKSPEFNGGEKVFDVSNNRFIGFIEHFKKFRLKKHIHNISLILRERGISHEDASDIILRIEEYLVANRLKIVEEQDVSRPPAQLNDTIPLPKTWEEAKQVMPSLKSWAEYRDANPDCSIIDYLSDSENGLGRWALVEPGIPRPALKKLYPITDPERPDIGSPYKALDNWLDRVAKKTRKRTIPQHLHIPDVSAEIDRLATLDEIAGREPTARVDAVKRARARRERNHPDLSR